ncbi:MAG: hypothetical protein K8W52_13660 [Deltaproteobacteria bacterium]|nr:hypothetical protein [Deltaproteobacteria bacterium]
MDLILPLPGDWSVESRDGTRIAHVAGSSITVTIAPLIPRPDDPRRWAQAAVVEAYPRGAAIEVVHSADATTDDGWPLIVIQTQAQPGGARIHLFYTFLVYAGSVLIAAPDGTTLDAHRAALLDLAGKGRPDFERGPVALSQLWAGVELLPSSSSGPGST